MSEDPTKDIGQKYETKPTIETVLQRINELGEQLNARMDGFEKKIEAQIEEKIEARFQSFEDRVGIRLDRIESEVKKTHSEFYELRADFREMRSEFRELRSHFKEPA
jgi:peptidoglycan hydrolase CwlO-like protein